MKRLKAFFALGTLVVEAGCMRCCIRILTLVIFKHIAPYRGRSFEECKNVSVGAVFGIPAGEFFKRSHVRTGMFHKGCGLA